MFGQNPIKKLEHDTDGETLQVVKSSPFYTIQGEGPFTGEPCVFLRLHGCHLACTFCDTQFSDPEDPVVGVDTIVKEIERVSPKGFMRTRHRLIVITGGEPMRQNIIPLVRQLANHGHTVQIETAGSFWLPHVNIFAALIVSPKTSMVHENVARYARAFKYVINADTKFTTDGIPFADTQGRGTPKVLARPHETNNCQIFYSPMNEYNEERNKANFAAVRDASLKFGHTAGVQLHTILGVD
jgi:7-carboxy-7-deazaguanine synthase